MILPALRLEVRWGLKQELFIVDAREIEAALQRFLAHILRGIDDSEHPVERFVVVLFRNVLHYRILHKNKEV
jgi:hypothetical protein